MKKFITSIKKKTKKHQDKIREESSEEGFSDDEDEGEILLANYVKLQTLGGDELVFPIYDKERNPPLSKYHTLIIFLEERLGNYYFDISTRNGIEITDDNYLDIIEGLIYDGNTPQWNLVLIKKNILSIDIQGKTYTLEINENTTLKDIFYSVNEGFLKCGDYIVIEFKVGDETVTKSNFKDILDRNRLDWKTRLKLIRRCPGHSNAISCGVHLDNDEDLCYQCRN